MTNTNTHNTAQNDNSSGKAQHPPLAYPGGVGDWVEDWLLPVVAVRLTTGHREGTYTWCRTWWAHPGVAVWLAALHAGWEAARIDGGAAMSDWLVGRLVPALRWILDAANGPLWRCTPDKHVDIPGLPFIPVPPGWFTTRPGTADHKRGFGPNFRPPGPGRP